MVQRIRCSCIRCRYYFMTRSACLAFPKGIPQEILDGEVDHKTPYPGDQGIQYEAFDGQNKELSWLFEIVKAQEEGNPSR